MKNVAAAVLAEMAFGTAAGVAASSKTVIRNACLVCGAQWFAGTSEEHRLRALSGQLGTAAQTAEEEQIASEERERQAQGRRSSIMLWVVALGILAVIITIVAVQNAHYCEHGC